MKKKFFLIAGIVVIILLCGGILIYTNDNYRFKLEYEVYNNIEFDNGKTIKTSIPYKNKIKYVKEEELEKILTSGTSVVYFGYPTCPWCRNIVPILIEMVQQSPIDTLYYVDVKSIETKQVLNILEEYLETDDEGNKRLYVPDVYFIKNGTIFDHHLGTVESYNNAFAGMTDEQKEELKDIYQKGIDLIIGE